MSRSTNTVAGRLVDTLSELGVDVVFGLPGVHNLPIWNALANSRIRLVGVRHEQAAAYAADGFAAEPETRHRHRDQRSRRRERGVRNRRSDGLQLTDPRHRHGHPYDPEAPGVYRGVLHETRGQADLFAPVTKAARALGTDEGVADAVAEAAKLALAPNAGPVYLGIPTDLLAKPAEGSTAGHRPVRACSRHRRDALLHKAAGLLTEARRPLIWAGGGAVRAGAGGEIGNLARRLGAPVLTTHMSRGLLGGHPCVAPGPVHDPEIGRLWDEADVVLAIGTDFDGMMTQNWRMPAPSQSHQHQRRPARGRQELPL